MIKTDKTFLKVLLLLSGALFLRLVKAYIGVLIFSIITAFFASGLYDRVLKKRKKQWLALSLTWTEIILVLVAPFMFIITMLVRQTGTFVGDIGQVVSSQIEKHEQIKEIDLSNQNLENLVNKAEAFVEEKNININIQSIYKKALGYFQLFATKITTWIYQFAVGIFGWFTLFFLYLITTTAILINKEKLLQMLKDILPLEEKQTELYLTRIGGMMTSIIKGTFVIALIQGIITGISFAIGGVPYSAFWTLLVCFLSLIPMVGAGVIAFPVGIILLLVGSIWQGIMVLVVNMIIVGNIDNILRPKLVSKTAKINGALLILSIFGGMGIFGLMGIFYGPVIMIFVLTTVEYYLEEVKKK